MKRIITLIITISLTLGITMKTFAAYEGEKACAYQSGNCTITYSITNEWSGNQQITVSITNGGQSGNIVIDMDITEESIKSLLKNITSAKYQMGDYYLNESSQGLGYSNLIYIHLQLEKYRKSIDPLVVNFLL